MGIEQLNVVEVVDAAVSGHFDIPEFQRGFVWRPDQVRDLIESLHRDYPVGSMLIWNAKDYEVPKTADGTVERDWIVDGQQRTTALAIAFGRKPYWWPDAASWNDAIKKMDVLVNMDSPADDFEFALTNPVRSHESNWISVRDILQCKDVNAYTALAFKIARDRDQTDESVVQGIMAMVGRLWTIRDRLIPVISIGHELEDVAEIFGRLNRAGTRVTEADVTVALIAASNPSWVRDAFLAFSNDLAERGFDLEPGVYIRTLTGIARSTARLKDVPEKFWKHDVAQVWNERVKTTISQVIHLLEDRGVLSSQVLPSRNSLIPLFTFWERFGQEISFDAAFRWFLLANADGRYSGSSTTTLTQDLVTIRDAPSAHAALAALEDRLQVKPAFEPDRFFEDYSRDRFGRLLLYLLEFRQGATDWVSDVRIGFQRDASTANEGFLPEWHHIFPRAVLRKAGRKESDFNLLANITVLNEATNRNKLRSKTPKAYIAEFDITQDELRRHLVPEGAPLSVDRYDDFIAERATELAAAATKWFQDLGNGSN